MPDRATAVRGAGPDRTLTPTVPDPIRSDEVPVRRSLRILLPLLLLGAVAAVLLLRDAAPEAVDLTAPAAAGAEASAADSDGDDVADGDGAADAAADIAAAAAITDPTGVWTVRTDLVPFDGAEGAGSWVGYRIDEELASVGAFTAVGRTPDVSGAVTVSGTEVVEARIEADLATLRSDSGSRDGQVRRVLGDRPAVFELDGPLGFDGIPAPGEPVLVEAPGRLRIGDVERPVTMMLAASLDGDVLVLRGTTDVVLADFDVTVPSAAIVLSVADVATVELQLLLTLG